jgi:hypothetical protein
VLSAQVWPRALAGPPLSARPAACAEGDEGGEGSEGWRARSQEFRAGMTALEVKLKELNPRATTKVRRWTGGGVPVASEVAVPGACRR